MEEIEIRFCIETDLYRNRINRLENSVSIGLPVVGSLLFLHSLAIQVPSISMVFIFALVTFATSIGVSIGHHRYFTHASFKTSRFGHALLGVLATVSMQGSILRWVADHRRHHRFGDRPGDPHSPYYDARGIAIVKRTRGLLHAHVLWMFSGYLSSEQRYARDVLGDRLLVSLSAHYWLVNLLFLTFLGALCVAFAGATFEAWQGFLLAGFVRVVCVHHSTWSVNSFGHMFGWRVQNATDRSTNSFILAILTLGDGFHSSHHTHPTSAINAPSAWDASGWLLRGLEKFGLVWQVRR